MQVQQSTSQSEASVVSDYSRATVSSPTSSSTFSDPQPSYYVSGLQRRPVARPQQTQFTFSVSPPSTTSLPPPPPTSTEEPPPLLQLQRRSVSVIQSFVSTPKAHWSILLYVNTDWLCSMGQNSERA